MLDKKTDAVLRLLVDKVGESYKVINKNQLLNALPEKLRFDMPNLLNELTFLQNNEYIDVKYQDKEEICLAVTVKASNYTQNVKSVFSKATITTRQIILLIGGVFAAAFLGALAAILIGRLF